MSRSTELKKMYDKIELDSTEDRLLLSKVKNGNASKHEIDELLDIVRANKNGGKILEEIQIFEKNLVKEMNDHIDALERMEDENIDVAHIEDESIKNLKYADMKKRYKKYVAEAEEILEAIKVAYFQIDNFAEYEDRLYNAKEELSFLK